MDTASRIVWVLQDQKTYKYTGPNWWLVDSLADAKLFTYDPEKEGGTVPGTHSFKFKMTLEKVEDANDL